MKIAYVGIKGLPSKGGMERVVEAIVKRLAGKHEITVYCDARYTPAETTIPGIKLIRMPSVPGKYTHPVFLFLLYALHAVLFGNYDLIHLHGVEVSFVLPILRLRYKVISTSHGCPHLIHRKKWGIAAQFLMKLTEYPYIYLSNYATSVSPVETAFYRSRYHKNIITNPNGTDVNITWDLNAACALLDQYDVEPGKYLLFAAGRIDPSKGCHIVIEALKDVKPEIPLLVVGDLEQIPAYGMELRQMAANRSIHFIPLIVNRELLYGVVRLSKLFIFPSISEAMSIMLLEAASLGVPMVCSDIPENRAVMNDNTLYFRSEDAQDLAKQIQWALQHYPHVEEIARRAKETVLQTLSWDRIALQYEELYQQCFSGSALSHP